MSVVKAGRLERPVDSFGRVPVSEDSAGEREEAGPGNMGSCWTGGEESGTSSLTSFSIRSGPSLSRSGLRISDWLD